MWHCKKDFEDFYLGKSRCVQENKITKVLDLQRNCRQLKEKKGKKKTQHKWKCLKISFLVSLDDSMGAWERNSWLWCRVLGPWCGCMLPAPFAIGRQGIMCHASGHRERREGCSWAPIPITSPFQPGPTAAEEHGSCHAVTTVRWSVLLSWT